MKPLLLSLTLLGLGIAQAELRTFTNTAGKSIQAELLAVSDGAAVLRLANGRQAKVPLKSLAPDDQTFVNEWWEKNKNKLRESDVRLTITKNSDRISSERSEKDKGRKSIDEYTFTCVLENRSKKEAKIKADYIIYKKSNSRTPNGSSQKVVEIKGTEEAGLLEASGELSFDTQAVRCEDSSRKVGGGKDKKPESYRQSETIQGIVVTLSAGGVEFLKQDYPDNLLKRLAEEEKRQTDREKSSR